MLTFASMMKNVKHLLLPEGVDFTANYTDFKECLNRPLGVGGFSIFYCREGDAEITLNFKPYKFEAGQILILFVENIMMPIKVSDNFSVFTISVSNDIADEILYRSSSDFFDYIYTNPLLSLTKEQRDLMLTLEQQILWIIKPENSSIAHKILINTLGSFFIVVENTISRVQNLADSKYKLNRGWILTNKFAKLLFEYGHVNRNVNFYATQLCVTPGYLYKVVYKVMNLTPKDLIDSYIISEIKLLLSMSDLAIKEIAEELHFEDPSYMCRFFRRRVGVSLSSYKESN